MGAYLSKDGINIEHHGAGWLSNAQNWADWLVLADTDGWTLTQNRGSIRKDSFYDEVVRIIKEQFKLRSKIQKSPQKKPDDSQTNLFNNVNDTKNKSKPKRMNFSSLTNASKQPSNQRNIQSTQFAEKRTKNPRIKK